MTLLVIRSHVLCMFSSMNRVPASLSSEASPFQAVAKIAKNNDGISTHQPSSDHGIAVRDGVFPSALAFDQDAAARRRDRQKQARKQDRAMRPTTLRKTHSHSHQGGKLSSSKKASFTQGRRRESHCRVTAQTTDSKRACCSTTFHTSTDRRLHRECRAQPRTRPTVSRYTFPT